MTNSTSQNTTTFFSRPEHALQRAINKANSWGNSHPCLVYIIMILSLAFTIILTPSIEHKLSIIAIVISATALRYHYKKLTLDAKANELGVLIKPRLEFLEKIMPSFDYEREGTFSSPEDAREFYERHTIKIGYLFGFPARRLWDNIKYHHAKIIVCTIRSSSPSLIDSGENDDLFEQHYEAYLDKKAELLEIFHQKTKLV